jgi:hypothetical protein
MKFLQIIIGDEHGALKPFFRYENQAEALPPSGSYQVGQIIFDYGHFPLRLYCLRISDSLVILFNGAEKTSKSAQGGATSMPFREANQFAGRIMEAIRRKGITVSEDGRNFLDEYGNADIEL